MNEQTGSDDNPRMGEYGTYMARMVQYLIGDQFTAYEPKATGGENCLCSLRRVYVTGHEGDETEEAVPVRFDGNAE